jgi:hypothetical protein
MSSAASPAHPSATSASQPISAPRTFLSQGLARPVLLHWVRLSPVLLDVLPRLLVPVLFGEHDRLVRDVQNGGAGGGDDHTFDGGATRS